MTVSSEDPTPKQKKYTGFTSVKNWLVFGFGVKSSREMHIHHIDQDPSNNDIRNLALLTPKEHRYFHRRAKVDSMLKTTRYFKRELRWIRKYGIDHACKVEKDIIAAVERTREAIS